MIRKPFIAEADALTALALRSKAHWGYSDDFMVACRDELTVTEQDLLAAHLSYRVLDVDASLRGFYCLQRLSDEQFELDALFVEPEHIGAGHGRELLAHAATLALARGGRRLLIQGDPHAEPFYRAAGATQVGTRPSGSIAGRELPLFELVL
ncbi:MAG: GNAT family N-acetyltransferase [Halieaceae bacterium]|nr:GNAT family N-acetyltransferase [Halieaceae bacterium]